MHALLVRISFLLAYLCCLSGYAQNINYLDPQQPFSQYITEGWQEERGMPFNNVLDIAQDSNGYLWLATFQGLVRFDGVKFELFNQGNCEVMDTDGILAVHADRSGSIWIGTNGHGIIRYKDGAFDTSINAEELRQEFITSFSDGKDGKLWVGTRNGFGYFKDDIYHPYTGHGIGKGEILALQEDHDGGLWIAENRSGLYRLHNNVMKHYEQLNKRNRNAARNFVAGENGRIYIGTEAGVYFHEAGEITLLHEQSAAYGFVLELHIDGNGTLWIGTEQGLLRYTDKKIEKMPKQQLPENAAIQAIFGDHEGSLWLGTYRQGFFRLKQGKFENIGIPEGLLNEVVYVIYQDSSTTWAGTEHGIAKIKGRKVERHYILGQKPLQNRVRDILNVPDVGLMVATYGGLFIYDESNDRFVNYKTDLDLGRARVLNNAGDGQVWVGTTRGLYKLRGRTAQFYGRAEGLENTFIMSLFTDKDSALWIGTNGGGIYKLEQEKITRFGIAEGLPGNIIFQISQDEAGYLWVGTSNGLARFNGKQFETFNDVLPELRQVIFQALPEKSDLWIFTSRGVLKVDKHSLLNRKDAVTVERFGKFDGMRSSEVTGASVASLDAAGQLWVATIKGITVINQNELPRNEKKPTVVIESALQDGEEVSVLEPIHLPAGTKRLTIAYTGLSFYAPEHNTFLYKLDGFDKDWIHADNARIAHYTNLPPGDYTFRVKAANHDGIWNDEGAALKINQVPFFYQTLWFMLTVCSLLFIAGLLVFYVRSRQLKIQNEKLQILVEHRTFTLKKQGEKLERQKQALAKANTIKSKLFSIISHDVRGPLNSLSQILKLTQSGDVSREEFEMVTKSLAQRTEQMQHLLENLLRWSSSQLNGIKVNKQHINLNDIMRESVALLEESAFEKEIALRDDCKVECYGFADAEMLKVITRNLLNNAIKFTESNGVITISLTEKEDFIEISIKDNGVGMDAKVQESLFNDDLHFTTRGTANEVGSGLGFKLSKEFVKLNGGDIWLESVVDEGSNFRFTVPKGQRKSEWEEVRN